MMFTRQAPVGLANFIRIGLPGHTKRFVIIGCHTSVLAKGASSSLAPCIFYFLSSTSTNSASTTSSFFFSEEAVGPSCGGAPVGGVDVVLYIASANLWLACVRLSTALLMSSTDPACIVLRVDSSASSTCFASAG